MADPLGPWLKKRPPGTGGIWILGVGGDRLVKEINRLLVLLQLIVGDAQKEVNPM